MPDRPQRLIVTHFLGFVLALCSGGVAASSLTERLEHSRQLHPAAAGYSVDHAAFRLGHFELKMSSGTVYPLEGGDGTVLGFFFSGDGLYRYSSEDPADRAVLERNLQQTGNRDLLDGDGLGDRIHQALAFFARTPAHLPWDPAVTADAPTTDSIRRRFERTWNRVGKTYLEYDHFTVEARTNDSGQYAYIEVNGKKEDIGYIHDRMRNFTERFVTFRKFSRFDLRFFQGLSEQLLDGGPDAHPPGAVLVDASLDVRVDDERRLRVTTEQTFRADREVSVLALRLDNHADPRAYDWQSDEYGLNLTSVRDGQGRALTYSHRYHEVLVELREPVAVGENIRLSFEIDGDYIQRFRKERKLNYFSLVGDAWYPRPFGRSGSDFTMRVRFETPKEYRPLSSGETMAITQGEESWVLHAKSEKPTKSIALAAGSHTTIERQFGDLTVRVHAFSPRVVVRSMKNHMNELAQLAADTIDVYSRLLVPYPFDSVEIVLLSGRYEGIAPQRFVLLGWSELHNRRQEARLVHELAHQWFGRMVAPASSRDNWLSESFAEYLSGVAMSMMSRPGGSNFETLRNQWWADAIDCRHAGSISTAYMLRGDSASHDRYRLLHSKGALVLGMLHSQLGDERFYEVLRRFLTDTDCRFATTDDFRHIVEGVLGQEMDWYFRQWIHEGGLPEITVSHHVGERDGKTWLSGTASLVNGHPFKRMGIPLVLEYESSQPEVRWIVFDAPQTPFEFELKGPPKQVKVDPARNFLAVFR